MIPMKNQIKVAALLACILMFGIAPVFSSQDYTRQEIIENSDACLDCHEDMDHSLKGSAHQITGSKLLSSGTDIGCISCHDGWQEHLEDPSEETISRISDKGMAVQADVCSRCHVTVHQASMATTDVHARAELPCSSCHTVHGNSSEHLVHDEESNYCLNCHLEVKADFQMRSSHPLHSGNIECVSCHPVSGISSTHQTAGINWTCRNCHSEKAGPFPFEHPVTFEHRVEAGGCVECHNPHGSNNDKLLKQPGDGVCVQCHGVPTMHRVAHSGLGTKMACVDCHSEVHGSFDNGKLLDPMLGSKLFPDCYQSGCHSGVR